MSIESLPLYKQNGNVLGADLPIATGPVVIDKTNAARCRSSRTC